MAIPTKNCKQCGENKAVTDFKERKNSKGYKYHMGTCRSCVNAYAAEWKRKKYQADPAYRAGHLKHARNWRDAQTPDERKFYSILKTYGLSREQYIDMMLEQDFRCPVCARPIEASRWVVDHCHETGKVRGLLDQNCNTLLGKAYDNIATLGRAQAYLEATGC